MAQASGEGKDDEKEEQKNKKGKRKEKGDVLGEQWQENNTDERRGRKVKGKELL